MSLGFGSVKGSGSSDRVTGPSEALPTQLSFHIWINRNGEGGGGLGRIFDRGSFLFFNNNPNTASTYALGLNSDRKSTRLNSSHGYISYAVFCLKKKKTQCFDQ